MDVLIEVHDEAELERALALRSPLIGINNRDLQPSRPRSRCQRAAGAARARRPVIVGESGIFTPADLRGLRRRHPHLPRRRKPDAAGRRRRATRALLAREPVRSPRAAGADAVTTAGKPGAHPSRQRRRGAHGRRVRQGRDRAHRGRRRPRGHAPETLDVVLAGDAKKGDVLGGGAHRRHHGGQAHPRADPAVPPAADHQGRGRYRTRPPAAGVRVRPP
jgi:hypothetical protein